MGMAAGNVALLEHILVVPMPSHSYMAEGMQMPYPGQPEMASGISIMMWQPTLPATITLPQLLNWVLWASQTLLS